MKLLPVIAVAVLLSGCSGQDAQPKGPFTLAWYPRNDTDYGDNVPGFETLAMCRRAGASKTMAYLIERHGYLPDYSAVEQPPWFECSTQCRPHMDGSFLAVCATVTEFRGEAARLPRMDAPATK